MEAKAYSVKESQEIKNLAEQIARERIASLSKMSQTRYCQGSIGIVKQ